MAADARERTIPYQAEPAAQALTDGARRIGEKAALIEAMMERAEAAATGGDLNALGEAVRAYRRWQARRGAMSEAEQEQAGESVGRAA